MIYSHTEKMVILNTVLNHGPLTFLGLVKHSCIKVDVRGLNEMIDDGFLTKNGNVYTGVECDL